MEDEILQGFLEESWENLGQLDSDIVAFEKETSDDELLARVFRTIHTIKGTCGFIGLVHIGAVAHAAENVLGKMRDNSIERSSDAISLVLDAVDILKELLQGLEATGEEPTLDYHELVEQLERVARGESVAPSAPDSAPAPPAAATTPQAVVDVNPDSLLTADGEVDFDALDRAINDAAARHRAKREQALSPAEVAQKTSIDEMLAAARPDAGPSPVTGPLDDESGRSGVSASMPAPTETAPTETVAPEAAATDAAPVSVEAETPVPVKTAPATRGVDTTVDLGEKKSIADLSIRVNVAVLDRLMNLVGELVLARNQLLQLSREDEESKYAAPLTHLNRITTDLQEGVMKTRMQPIGNAWSKLPRLVRDLSKVTGKVIELEMHGEDTELDRTVLDAIKDPLTHMVRNSADHGLESSAERIAVGKPEKGTIRLNAYHEGGHVIICIEDDGGGINTEKVLQRMIAQGMTTEADAANLSEYEIHQAIFRPGFSTAEKVSSVSGRGVGMDVVRTEIERIGGAVDLLSRRGEGTTVRIKIPLTLAIVSALVVECDSQSFAIPQLGIVELVRLPAEERERIERVHDKQVFRLRNRLLPLVRLSDVLELESQIDEQNNINIVVVQVGEEEMGLIVDRVFDTEEIVVKPVGSLLKDLSMYQGTTILGDGRVIMILDVAGIASEFGSLSTSEADRDGHHDQDRAQRLETTRLLVFDAGGQKTMAVPLSLVSRLEELPRKTIEQSSNGPVAQYRGTLLPLVGLGGQSGGEIDPQPVIVFTDGKKSMGLMVDAIQDVVEEQLQIQVQSHYSGVLGTAVINGKATEVIDTQHYLIQTDPEWFRKSNSESLRVLLVNPSAFFRQLLVTALQSEQYGTFAVESPEQALETLERDNAFDLVLLDYDHRDSRGGDFVAALRTHAGDEQLPILALCSKLNPYLQEEADQAGVAALLEKLDVSELNREIDRLCGPRKWKQEKSA